jgi:hypothetical protein
MGRKTGTKVPKLRSLPPSRDAFKENVKWAHIPTAICKSALECKPSALDPAEYGWERGERVRYMVLVTPPPNVSVAPSEVLKMIKCGCTTDTPCSTAMCECHKAHFP